MMRGGAGVPNCEILIIRHLRSGCIRKRLPDSSPFRGVFPLWPLHGSACGVRTQKPGGAWVAMGVAAAWVPVPTPLAGREASVRSVQRVGGGPFAKTGICKGRRHGTGSLTLRGESAPPNHPGLFNKGCLPAIAASNLPG